VAGILLFAQAVRSGPPELRQEKLQMRRLALIVAAVAITLSACGSGTESSAAPVVTGVGAEKLIAASADKAADAKTARIAGEVTIDAGGKTRTLPLDGALDFGSGAFEFSYDLSQLGLPGASGAQKIQARLVDGTMYLNLGDLAGKAGKQLGSMLDGKSWVKLDLGSLGLSSGGSSGALGDANPKGTLDALRGAGEVEKVGTDTLRGVATTHYRATIDPQKALEDAPPALHDKVQKGLDALGGPVPVDVWIDGDGQARKIATDVDVKGVKASTTIEYYDFGTKVDVSAPPADEVLDFSQLFGGLRTPTNNGGPAV
jgi:hypothetical protein